MNKKSLILFPVVLSILLCATGCSKTEKINYDIDSEINKIISPDLYPKDLLNKDVQDELKQNATNKDIAFVDPTLIGYESAKNQIPTEELFLYTKQNQDATTFDWLGEKWSMTRFEYKLDISAVRIRVGFNNDEREYASKKIRELSDSFLRNYSNIIFESNIYEYDFEKLKETPVRLIAEIEDAYIDFNISMIGNEEIGYKPCVEVFFVHKKYLHNLDDYDLRVEIESLEKILKFNGGKSPFRTIRLSSTEGYIIVEPKDEEDLTPEEEVIAGGIFYN